MGLASDVGHLLSHTAIGTATFGRGWPDLGPRVPETLPIWTLPIDEPMRLFHSEFARHLFTQAQTLRLLDRPKVVNTLGLTLATACALGDTTTVALIATGCQSGSASGARAATPGTESTTGEAGSFVLRRCSDRFGVGPRSPIITLREVEPSEPVPTGWRVR